MDPHHLRQLSVCGKDERWDPANGIAVCRECHDWIHDHIKEATEGGWLR